MIPVTIKWTTNRIHPPITTSNYHPYYCMANRRSNSSAFQLSHNIASGSSSRHPAYHGIQCRGGRWVSQIREPNKTSYIWLGSYQTPEMAAAAYDVAALALKGTYAVLNFPESAISNTLPEFPTDDDIRAAAAQAAAARAPGGRDTTPALPPATSAYLDDEAVFGMPNLLYDMAQGMLLSPPRIDYNYSPQDVDGTCYYGGGNLWNY